MKANGRARTARPRSFMRPSFFRSEVGHDLRLRGDLLKVRVGRKIAHLVILAAERFDGIFELLIFEIIGLVAVDVIEEHGKGALVAVACKIACVHGDVVGRGTKLVQKDLEHLIVFLFAAREDLEHVFPLNALAVKGKHTLFDGVRIALQVFRGGVFEFFVLRLQQDVEIDGKRLLLLPARLMVRSEVPLPPPA